MKKINKISLKSLGYTMVLVAFALGVLRLVLLLISSKINPDYVARTFPLMAQSSAWGLIQIFLIYYPLAITVMALIFGLVYNLVAKITGGISVDLK
jgi:hypothetical protein